MSAVWRAARAAVRRRRLQTFVIGLVVLMSTATTVVALALLDASSAPFDRAFAAQRGAHVVAAFDRAKVTSAQLDGQPAGVAAVAGPFGQVILEPAASDDPSRDGPLTVVGRADPGGPVDQLDLWRGRWPIGPGEIVLNAPPLPRADIVPDESPVVADGVTLKVVGWAYSLSQSADGWVSPEQMDALHPTTTQVLYRFAGDVSTKTAVEANLAAITSVLPSASLLAAQSYLLIKAEAAGGAAAYVPFLATFGILGLVVAVLIVGNVVSGAVVSGFRQIGILKALGFTPGQVVGIHLAMVLVPALVGCVIGTAFGDVAARLLLNDTFRRLGLGGSVGASAWVWTTALVGMPLIVVLAALVPAMRAHRLSAAEAVSAGTAPRSGRGLRVQRWLSGTRLPRSVTLGLGLPLVRPGRTALTLAAVLFGVMTVTVATGLAGTLTRVSTLSERLTGQVGVRIFNDPTGMAGSTRSDAQIEELLRGQPHTARVAVLLSVAVSVVGQNQPLFVNFGRGEVAAMGYGEYLLAGRWLERPDEIVAPTELLRERGLVVGDQLTVVLDGRRATLTIVGQTLRSSPGRVGVFADWRALTDLAPGYQIQPRNLYFQVQLDDGADAAAYAAAVRATDSGLDAWDNGSVDEFMIIVIGFSSVLSLLLAAVAGLGVLNTVVLNVRERRRDLGMLRSIGMTPRQTVAMVVTSMAVLGVVGGLLGIPLGMLAHRIIVPLAADAANIAFPASVTQVWQPATLALLGLSGVAIAVLGALLPARSAARLTIATVLHNE